MAQIEWDELPDAKRVRGFKAELLVRINDQEARAPFNGGWLLFADGQHTVGSPQAVTADTSTLITIDGLGSGTEDEFRRGINNDVWSDNTLRPNAVGESYLIRLNMRVSKAVSNDAYLEVDLGIGENFATLVADERRPLTKGSGAQDNISLTFPVYCLSEFGRNGGRFFVVASENVNIWNKSIFIQRLFTP